MDSTAQFEQARASGQRVMKAVQGRDEVLLADIAGLVAAEMPAFASSVLNDRV